MFDPGRLDTTGFSYNYIERIFSNQEVIQVSLKEYIYIYIWKERVSEKEKIDNKIIQAEGEIYWETKSTR